MSDDAPFEPKALRVARTFRGLGVLELAKAAGVSRQIVGSIENGALPPYRPAVQALAAALRFPLRFFYTLISAPDRSVFHWRKAASVPEHVVDSAIARAAVFGSISRAFRRFAKFATPKLPSALPRSADEIEMAAESLRRAVGLRNDTPIVDAVRVAEAAGVIVGTFDPGPMSIDGYACRLGEPIVMLSNAAPWSRQRLSVMHEIGHLVLHESWDAADKESQATRFAGAVLVPAAAFRREFPRLLRGHFDWSAMLAMKQRWGISIQALVHRAHDLGLIDAAQYRTAFIHVSKFGWRTSEPGESEPERPHMCEHFVKALQERGQLAPLCDETSLYVETVEEVLNVSLEEPGVPETTEVIRLPPRQPPPN